MDDDRDLLGQVGEQGRHAKELLARTEDMRRDWAQQFDETSATVDDVRHEVTQQIVESETHTVAAINAVSRTVAERLMQERPLRLRVERATDV